MKKLSITVSLVLIVTLAYCQEGYPKKVIEYGDTVVVLNVPQIKAINYVFDERDFLKNKVDSLYLNIEGQSLMLDKQLSINKQLVEKNNQILIEMDWLNAVNDTNKAIIEYQRKELSTQKKKGAKLAIGGVLVGVSAGTILTLILN
jgi:hypothetical protein